MTLEWLQPDENMGFDSFPNIFLTAVKLHAISRFFSGSQTSGPLTCCPLSKHVQVEF